MAVCQNLVPQVNIKIAGKWMFIPLKMVLIGIDPYPYIYITYICEHVCYIIAELHLRFCRCCSCGFLLCLCSFSLVFGKPNAIDHPQVMTMFLGVKHPPSFQSESKHTVQVETWKLCQTLPLPLPASWQPLPWNKSSVLLRLKQSEKWWCLLPATVRLGSPTRFFLVARAVTDQATLMHFFLQTTSERPKRQRLLWLPRSSSTTVLSKSVTICWNCQGLQSSEAKKCDFVWQSLAAKEFGWGDEGPTIHQFDFAHLVGSPSPPSTQWMWTLTILHQDFPQTSLPKFQSSLPHGSHTAPGSTNFNYSSTLRLKIVKQKKVNHWESHKHDRNIMPSWLDSAPKWNKKENWKNQNKKEKGTRKENEGRRKD